MKKNVALCYSGQIRNFKECFATHVKHIVEANEKEFNFFIFGHFWNDNALHGKQYWNNLPERGGWDNANVHAFLNCNPDSFILEKPIEFNSQLIPDPRFPHPIQNTLSMFASMHGVNTAKNIFCYKRNMIMDVVLRMRTDLFFNKNISLTDFNSNYLYVDSRTPHMSYAVHDLFAIGSNDNMNTYFSVLNNVNALVNEGCAINPECLLGFHLNKQHVKLHKIPMQDHAYKLFRDL